ncbi:hypothetical protein C2845_PM15G18910 [Panicum miliaceum]|uniref:DUF1618 domain-containing protein n=1 Tax=Panicum miliaceum TaxID=4540 RepID=A0A3L6Q9U2_PANMI|nr:hypothetical protein C2845_PM15G18910 [Panicum miliaceum]
MGCFSIFRDHLSSPKPHSAAPLKVSISFPKPFNPLRFHLQFDLITPVATAVQTSIGYSLKSYLSQLARSKPQGIDRGALRIPTDIDSAQPASLMSAQVPSVHPSLCPPRHGHPPDEGGAPPPSWVLLDLHAYVADRENATSAYSMMSNGAAIRVTFCTAPPPLVSYICVWCPSLPPSELVMEPTVESAEEDLVHFRVPIRAHSSRCDHFVYKAPNGGKGPSLSWLERPDRYLHYRRSIALLAHHEVGDIRTHVEDDGHYYLATLNHDSSRPGHFNLLLYNSMEKKWSSSNVSLDRPHIHVTAKTITLGEGGLLGFVDPWRGILVCDILGRKPEHYLPLPEYLIRLDKLYNEPLLSRDIAFINGRLTLVEMYRSTSYPDRSLNRLSWEVSTWSISSPWEGQDGWQMDYKDQY